MQMRRDLGQHILVDELDAHHDRSFVVRVLRDVVGSCDRDRCNDGRTAEEGLQAAGVLVLRQPRCG